MTTAYYQTRTSHLCLMIIRDHRGRDRMVVGFTTIHAITTNVVSSNPAHSEVYSIQNYVIKFVSDLQLVLGFLRDLGFLYK